MDSIQYKHRQVNTMAKLKSFFSLASKVAILKIPPEAWDAIIPHGHKVSRHLVEYMAAGLVRDIAYAVDDTAISAKLLDIGQGMATFASRGLVQGWEEGDDICPPWPPFPAPWPWRQQTEEPEPEPVTVKSVEQMVLADFLASLADVTIDAAAGAQLRNTAFALAKVASGQVVAEFEATGVTARHACA